MSKHAQANPFEKSALREDTQLPKCYQKQKYSLMVAFSPLEFCVLELLF